MADIAFRVQDTKPVATRESRLNSITAYGGGCRGLSSAARQGCLKNAPRSFTQATVCQEMYSILTLFTIRNSVAVVHGPAGCASCGIGLNMFNRLGSLLRQKGGFHNASWFSTELGENEIIHGGEAKLRDAVIAADQRLKPEAIFIITTCVSGIIGDPLADIVRTLQDEVSARLIPIHCEGFKSAVWVTGCDAAFHGIINYLLEDRPKEPGLVNVVSPLTISRPDELEVIRLLTELGVTPNFVPCFATVEDVRRTVSAEATTALCLGYGEYLVRYLNERYGVPNTKEVMPLGIDGTDRWLRSLGELLGKSEAVEALIAKEREKTRDEVARLRKILQGKRIYVQAGQARAVTLAELADDLGFEIIGITLFHYDEVVEDYIHRLAARSKDFVVNVANVQPFEQANLLNRLKPDLVFAEGLTTAYPAIQGFPTMAIFDYGACYLGYEGVLNIGQRMADAIQNPGLSKGLSQHLHLPYRESWYERDPFSHITVNKPEEEFVYASESK